MTILKKKTSYSSSIHKQSLIKCDLDNLEEYDLINKQKDCCSNSNCALIPPPSIKSLVKSMPYISSLFHPFTPPAAIQE